jgi:hypothetical protein
MLVFVEGGKPENLEKNPRSKGENQQQTQLTYDTKSGNPTRVTVVRGERSHRYPSHASQYSTVLITIRSKIYFSGGRGIGIDRFT